MTDAEFKNLLAKVENLEAEVKRLKSEKRKEPFSLEQIEYFESLPATAIVGKDYVSWRLGVSERAVKQSESGTAGIKRFSNKPLKFVKRDVDEVWRERKRTPKEIAPKFRAEARPVKKRLKSIITKTA